MEVYSVYIMFKIINIFNIVKKYIQVMKEDLKPIPLFTNLILLPILMAFYLFYFVNVNKIIQFTVSMIPTATILLVIIYCHVNCNECVNSRDRVRQLKWKLLNRVNTTLTVIIITSLTILFISDIVILKPILLYLSGFVLVNLIIVVCRLYRLIDFEIGD